MDVEQFKQITGSDDETAKFYLSMAKNDITVAVAQYFDTVSSGGDPGVGIPQTSPQVPSNAPRKLGTGGVSEPVALNQNLATSNASGPAKNNNNSSAAKKPSKFATLSDFGGSGSGGGDDDDDDESNRFFAGGGGRGGSGQQIIGADTDDLTSKIFKKAQESGAVPVTSEPKSQAKPVFSGSGRRLGVTADPAPSAPAPSVVPKPNPLDQEPPEEKTITITFYDDGFTIDDGELRLLDDPNNKKFLESIHNGYVPYEVSQGSKHVNVNLKKVPGKYVPPPKKFKAFEGSGKTLGGSSSNASAQVPAAAATATTATQSTPSVSKYKCDMSKPHTSIQIRLSDGTRLVSNFNLSDTVRTVVNFVQSATPGNSNFILMTTFPRKELTDLSQSIQDAKLENASLVQMSK